MTQTKQIPLLLTLVLAAYTALAQTSTGTAPANPADGNEILVARGQYVHTINESQGGPQNDGSVRTLAQISQRGPVMPYPPRRGYPNRGGYQSQWMNHGDAGHALIGGAIGFGIGAALGAIGSVHGGTPVAGGVIIGGSIFGLIGTAIGASHGSFQMARRRNDRRNLREREDNDEEPGRNADSLGSHGLESQTERSSSATPASAPPERVPHVEAAAALPPHKMPAIP
jgi:hypothetical protein